MKANIDVQDRREADAIKRGLEDPAVRAFVVIIGVMKELPNDRARARVMQYVKDRLDEEDERKQISHDGNGGTEDRGA